PRSCSHCGSFLIRSSASLRTRRSVWFRYWPQSKPAAEGVGIVARTSVRRKRRELPHVAASDHRFVGLERGDEPCHNVGDVPPPLLLAVPFQSGVPHIVLIGALLVGQVTEFHGLDNAVDDHG